MFKKCKTKKIEGFQCIWQMGNVFLNVQQMFA
jgi:hypothetical protein